MQKNFREHFAKFTDMIRRDEHFAFARYSDGELYILQNKELVLSEGNLVLQDRVVVITWEQIRSRRNNLLTSSDYTQMADWPGDKTAWATYRQALRDLTQTYTNAADVIWPTAPGA